MFSFPRFTPILGEQNILANEIALFSGIGLHLASLLLKRPHTTVIATVRASNTSTNELDALERDKSSRLIIGTLSTDEVNTPAALLSSLTRLHNITHVDVLIVNAASSVFTPTLETTEASIKESFAINTFLPVALFQVFHPLLIRSNNPRFVYMSSMLGSIGALQEDGMGTFPILAYGAAKAASDYFTRKIHYEFPQITSVVIHPGYVNV